MNAYKIRAFDASAGGGGSHRDFLIDAPTAADAIVIFEYRYRRNGQKIRAAYDGAPWEPSISEPIDVIPVPR